MDDFAKQIVNELYMRESTAWNALASAIRSRNTLERSIAEAEFKRAVKLSEQARKEFNVHLN